MICRLLASLVWHSQGCYFARDASYSVGYAKADSQGVQTMIRTRLFIGAYKVGDSTIKALPNGLHSTVNSLNDPSIYVTYHDNQPYPEHVIRFKSKRLKSNCLLM
jgi:hypothetical protein